MSWAYAKCSVTCQWLAEIVFRSSLVGDKDLSMVGWGGLGHVPL